MTSPKPTTSGRTVTGLVSLTASLVSETARLAATAERDRRYDPTPAVAALTSAARVQRLAAALARELELCLEHVSRCAQPLSPHGAASQLLQDGIRVADSRASLERAVERNAGHVPGSNREITIPAIWVWPGGVSDDYLHGA